MKKLTKLQRKALEDLNRLGIFKAFYLAGGTALTIKYDHRYSEDFDFFLLKDESIDFLKFSSISFEKEIIEMDKDTLIFYYNQIKFSFFKYPYPLLEKPSVLESSGIKIASDVDIAGMKSIAIMQRGEKKDFFDLWYLMNHHQWDLKQIIKICNQKYVNSFNEQILLKALVYFEDAEKSQIAEIDSYWEEIKKYFIDAVKKQIF